MPDPIQQTQVGFPFQLDGRGRVSDPGAAEHIEQMIELVLFTVPGERVNRPSFGCGLLRDIFNAGTETNLAVIERSIESALQKWLGTVIKTNKIQASLLESRVDVLVEYQLIESAETRSATFSSGLSGSIS